MVLVQFFRRTNVVHFCTSASNHHLSNLMVELEQGRINPAACAAALQVCGRTRALSEGKRIHEYLEAGDRLERHRYLVGHIITMYGKCGALAEAEKLHDKRHCSSVFTWTSMIRAFVHNKLYREALQHFKRMLSLNIKPTFNTYIPLVNACGGLADLDLGRWVHSHITDWDLKVDAVLGNGLISMYRKCGSLEDARSVFDNMPLKDVVSWNSMIAAYLERDWKKQALELFKRMIAEGVKPSNVSYILVLDSCLVLLSLEEAKLIHADIVKAGLQGDVMVGTALLHMYGKFGKLDEAKRVFSRINEHNVVSWTAMIAACSHNGRGDEGIAFFKLMQQEGIKPNVVTFVSVLNSCTRKSSEAVDGIRAQISESGLLVEHILGTALVSTYGRCNDLVKARDIFEKLNKSDAVSWNAMVASYIQQEHCKQGMQLFHHMLLAGTTPTALTFITLLNGVEDLRQGKLLHALAAEAGFNTDLVVGNAFLSMYGKCGSLEDAKTVFHSMQSRDVITWNTLMGACVQHGVSKQALEIFNEMEAENVKPDNITFVTLLDASCNLVSLTQGKLVHAKVLASGLEKDIVVENALLNMYAKCGNLELAGRIFESLGDQSVVSWTSLVAAHAQHGHVLEALKLFRKMQQSGEKPNEVTFISALAACTHAGLLEEGCLLFSTMVEEYGIIPSSKHFGCLVDLLGRSGWLKEAENLLLRLPSQADSVPWMALMGSCKSGNDVDRGERCADRILELGSSSSAPYTNLANLYAATGS